MRPSRAIRAAGLAFFLGTAGAALADTQFDAYDALGIEAKDVVVGTVLTADVAPDPGDEVVALVDYLTGRRDRERAVEVRLAVFRREGGRLKPIYDRRYGEQVPGGVGRGELQLVDLDRDDRDEIVVTYDDGSDPLVDRRRGEVLYWGGTGFEVGWSGEMAYDATRDARGVAPDRRDRWKREIDLVGTMRARGRTLYLAKTVYAVAGETLAQPKTVTETFPLIRPPAP